MDDQELIPNLFRSEFSKIISVLCKTYGFSNMQLAEDIVSDTFLKATETWGLKGIPQNPTGWLYTAAKNRAIDNFRRERVFRQKITPELMNQNHPPGELEIDLSENNIKDSQLQMFFAICNPLISSEAQVALALRILCGFGVSEIATAFLTNKATINKRLQRAKSTLKDGNIDLGIPSAKEMENRLGNVLSVLYLLFNEGYYSTTNEKNIRKELCFEAMRLNYLLLDFERTNTGQANALMALFCFHASRFEARTDSSGEQVIYAKQDIKEWNSELIRKGEHYLHLSSKNQLLTKYHLEAAIAFYHTCPEDSIEKWEHILQLYNKLLQYEYSSIVALNRTYALAKANGVDEAIAECLKIDLKQNHLYHLLLSELYSSKNLEKEKEHLHIAASIVQTKSERKWILKKIENISKKVS